MPDDDLSLSEKRMYGETRPETHAYVASGLGVTRVETAGGQVGRFTLAERCTARDVAGANGEVAVATDESVLVLTGDGFVETGFGAATAVGYGPEGLWAAGEDGTVARYDDGWTSYGRVEDVRALGDGLLGAADGVYELPELGRAGLADVTDVATNYAATTAGLYRRAADETDSESTGNGAWTEVRSGPHSAVATDGDTVYAAGESGLYAADESAADGAPTAVDWRRCDLPVRERVVDVTGGAETYAVTEDGTFLVATTDEATADGRGGWRQRSLGLPAVVGVAVA